jgi:hypothetical protein
LIHLGRIDEARDVLDAARRQAPDFSLAALRLALSAADHDFLERMSDGLRKAGMKE